jgi:ribosomal-protein-alanine N-acetyltransferase
MFSPFAKAPAPFNRNIGAERSAECAKIHAASFAHPWRETDIEQLLFAPEVFATGAIDAKDLGLAGFIMSRAALDEAEILTLAVANDRRRGGIGRSLLATHMATLAAIGVKKLFLEVDADNSAALALYVKFGFHAVAEREAYYRTADSRRAKALVMRLDMP